MGRARTKPEVGKTDGCLDAEDVGVVHDLNSQCHLSNVSAGAGVRSPRLVHRSYFDKCNHIVRAEHGYWEAEVVLFQYEEFHEVANRERLRILAFATLEQFAVLNPPLPQ